MNPSFLRAFALVVAIAATAAVAFLLYPVVAGDVGPAPNPPAAAADKPDAHEGEEHEGEEGEHEEGAAVRLTQEQMAMAGIAVEALAPAPLPRVFRAPGEVDINNFTSAVVAARVSGTVLTRHARVGDRVVVGQKLITLFSVEMAEAISAFQLAERELKRVQKLGTGVVSAQRIEEAKVKFAEARSRLGTLGLSEGQISAIGPAGTTTGRAGQFDLLAPQPGLIVSDEFKIGEVVEAGRTLFEISEPSSIWIRTHVSPTMAPDVTADNAVVFVLGTEREGRVVQRGQKLEEATRTIEFVVEIDNSDGWLRPGQFVDVRLFGAPEPMLSVPTEAVLRGPDGDWVVYIESEPGAFEPREVEVLYATGGRSAIGGVEAGTRVVTTGAFFVMGEAAKAGFDPHNH